MLPGPCFVLTDSFMLLSSGTHRSPGSKPVHPPAIPGCLHVIYSVSCASIEENQVPLAGKTFQLSLVSVHWRVWWGELKKDGKKSLWLLI